MVSIEHVILFFGDEFVPGLVQDIPATFGPPKMLARFLCVLLVEKQVVLSGFLALWLFLWQQPVHAFIFIRLSKGSEGLHHDLGARVMCLRVHCVVSLVRVHRTHIAGQRSGDLSFQTPLLFYLHFGGISTGRVLNDFAHGIDSKVCVKFGPIS